MKKFLLLLLLVSGFLFVSCGTGEHEGIPIEVQMKEEKAVWDVIEKYNNAYANKDFAGLVDFMSQEVVFFGTDSAEVIKSLAEYKEAMEKQWEQYDSMVFGKIEESEKFLQMDRNATLASVMFGAPLFLTIDGKENRVFVRVHRTLKKENKRWLIVTGLISIASGGSSTGEIPHVDSLTNTEPDATE
jgi:ketosteroid isomerase-like protein